MLEVSSETGAEVSNVLGLEMTGARGRSWNLEQVTLETLRML